MGEGLLPKWRAGHVIRDVAGFFAAVFLINVILSTVVGAPFPSLEPGGIDLRSKAIGLVWAPSTSIGMLGGVIFYVINPVLICLLWFAYREVGTEQERRHAG